MFFFPCEEKFHFEHFVELIGGLQLDMRLPRGAQKRGWGVLSKVPRYLKCHLTPFLSLHPCNPLPLSRHVQLPPGWRLKVKKKCKRALALCFPPLHLVHWDDLGFRYSCHCQEGVLPLEIDSRGDAHSIIQCREDGGKKK